MTIDYESEGKFIKIEKFWNGFHFLRKFDKKTSPTTSIQRFPKKNKKKYKPLMNQSMRSFTSHFLSSYKKTESSQNQQTVSCPQPQNPTPHTTDQTPETSQHNPCLQLSKPSPPIPKSFQMHHKIAKVCNFLR